MTLLMAVVCMSTGAMAQTTPIELPDDDRLESAQACDAPNQTRCAEAVLRQLAEAGHVVAMERLALMHWYGRQAHPGEKWSRAFARQWFARAANKGSDLGRHMLRMARRPDVASAVGAATQGHASGRCRTTALTTA